MSGDRRLAETLEGVILEGGWEVLTPVETPEDHTGGTFSVGYLVRHKDGRMGYLKAFDYEEAFKDPDPPRALERLAVAYNAERDLLTLCGKRNLRRVVRALASGTIAPDGNPSRSVSYLIFELADSDARAALAGHDPANHVPVLRLAHNAAVAMMQLHSIGVAHQDVKPSNLLVWNVSEGFSGKISDLGCAFVEGRPTSLDDELVPGDCSYAPPEQLYKAPFTIEEGLRRFASDMYMLGNLFCFLLTGMSYNGLLFLSLDDSLHWQLQDAEFEAVLPALIDAHGLTMRMLEEVIHMDICGQSVELVHELCYPDPRLRGHSQLGQRRFALGPYVTRLDVLYRRAAIAARHTA